MKRYAKILFSILAAAICTSAFAAEPTPQSCKKSGKNCPMMTAKPATVGRTAVAETRVGCDDGRARVGELIVEAQG
jgi:hypothetical protein